jgi:putative glycosyltransferase (TIGR04372 family)
MKFIGWGTSKCFNDLYDQLSLKIDYLIDSDSSKWNSQVRGLEVYAPERILSEDTKDTIIIIFSSYDKEIRSKIQNMGNYRVVNAYFIESIMNHNKGFFWGISYHLFYPIWWMINILVKFRFKKLRVKRLWHMHIGHLAANTECDLRQQSIKEDDERALTIYICDFKKPYNEICNKDLLNMIRRRALVIQNPMILNCLFNVIKINPLSYCDESSDPFYLPTPSYNYDVFNNVPRQLSLTSEEETQGVEILQRMGIKPEEKFICFHNRDDAYFKKVLQDEAEKMPGIKAHNIRNFSVQSLLPAIEYITEKGMYGLRMGVVANERVMNENPRVIDYALDYRTEFGDVYLTTHCKFFLAGTTGLSVLPIVFDIPVIATNMLPLGLPTYGKNDLFIPKKLWSTKYKRFLTFREQVEIEGNKWVEKIPYADLGIEIIDNSAEEILAVTKEMNDRIDGVWVTTQEDEEMQAQYKALFVNLKCAGFPARIGAQFLRQNRELL